MDAGASVKGLKAPHVILDVGVQPIPHRVQGLFVVGDACAQHQVFYVLQDIGDHHPPGPGSGMGTCRSASPGAADTLTIASVNFTCISRSLHWRCYNDVAILRGPGALIVSAKFCNVNIRKTFF